MMSVVLELHLGGYSPACLPSEVLPTKSINTGKSKESNCGCTRNGLIKMDKGVSKEQRAGCDGTKGDLSELMGELDTERSPSIMGIQGHEVTFRL